jgi:hypothetical protein
VSHDNRMPPNPGKAPATATRFPVYSADGS